MHEVKVAKSAGFCFGVERAVRLAVSALEESSGPVYTLGPIIHNPQEVERLKGMGIRMAESLDQVPSGTVVIRSHGAPRGVMEEAQKRGMKVIDATCPLVNRLKERVSELGEEGYQVVIVGESDHPEVMAVLSYAPQSCIVTRSSRGLEGKGLKKKLGIVAQTTQSLGSLQEVASHCISISQETRVFNTICLATHKRRQEALSLARQVSAMIVVGGKNSANTTKLADAVGHSGTPTYHIESAEEIPALPIPRGVPLGVTAGASTPAWVISEVVKALENLD